MKCNTCLIAITFLISSVYLALVRPDTRVFSNFTQLLNKEQLSIYHSIVRERGTIYATGVGIGILLGYLYYRMYPKQPYLVCTVIAIAYITKLAVYYLFPKSPLMLYSLTSTQQTDAWAKIYEHMKYRYKLSLLIGFLGYIVFFVGMK